jgi:hypothetical protein
VVKPQHEGETAVNETVDGDAATDDGEAAAEDSCY